MYQKFPKNGLGRDFVVGDIHGHYDDLMAELERHDFDFDVDRLFSVGDLCDRGPNSPDCANLVNKPWFHAVIGNHEVMLIGAARTKSYRDVMSLITNGGGWTEYLPDGKLEEIAEDFKKLPVALEFESKSGRRIALVHAEIDKSFDEFIQVLSSCDEELFKSGYSHVHTDVHCAIWGRSIINVAWPDVPDVDEIFHGHTPVGQVKYKGNRTYIDTGVFIPSGRLTVLEVL